MEISETDWVMLGRTVARLEREQLKAVKDLYEAIALLGERVQKLEDQVDGLRADVGYY